MTNKLREIYNIKLAMVTDLYQINMAYASWKTGKANKEAVFEYYFRTNPFNGGYAITCGLNLVLDLIEDFGFDKKECDFLGTLVDVEGNPLYEKDFLKFLRKLRLTLDVDAVSEGRVVFGQEPGIRVTGSELQCRLLESLLLNLMNFNSLIATKAARVKQAAFPSPVSEFGLRRAQGIDGAISAARAAYIGGSDATSNVAAAMLYDIPVKGTHAHCWVMSFDSELESFRTFAEAMPTNSVFLVDTYDTKEGVKNAIEVGLWLKSQGKRLLGIRLDSGDLAYLSIEARRELDKAGLQDVPVFASNDLDEHIIMNLKAQGAQIGVWCVGTKLVTAYDQPALGGVFKMMAVREIENDPWKLKIKLSEQSIKTTTPGLHQVRRFYDQGLMVGDMIFNQELPPTEKMVIVDPADATRRKNLSGLEYEDLLLPVVRDGTLLKGARKPTEEIKKQVETDLAKLHAGVKRFTNPHQYPVGLELSLHELKNGMILARRGLKEGA